MTVRNVVFVVLVASLLVPMHRLRLAATRRYVAGRTTEDLYYLPPPRWLRVMDGGFHEATSDVLWSVALVYSGDGLRNRMGARHVVSYARAMTTLDPNWQRPYRWAGIAAAYQAVSPPVDQLQEAGEYVSEGASRFPDDGALAWTAGTFLSFELAPRLPVGSKQREDADRRGLVYMSNAARHGAGPAWLAMSNAARMSRSGSLTLAIEHLQDVYASTTDASVRAEIAERLVQLGAAVEAGAATEADEMERLRVASYPYLPAGLFHLVGRRIGDESPP